MKDVRVTSVGSWKGWRNVWRGLHGCASVMAWEMLYGDSAFDRCSEVMNQEQNAVVLGWNDQ